MDTIPHTRDILLGEVEKVIALEFFEEDAYNRRFKRVQLIKSNLLSFIRTLLSYLWNQVRKSMKIQFNRLDKGKAEVADEYKSM